MGAAKRNYFIDLLKLLAAFGVVAIHVQSDSRAAAAVGDFFSPFCVPFFFIISLLFFVNKLDRLSLPEFLRTTWLRLVVPFLAWSILYLALHYIKDSIMHKTPDVNWGKAIFYGGTAVQMYFVPQLILMQALIYALYLLTNKAFSQRMQALLILLAAFVYMYFGYSWHCFGMTRPLPLATYILCAFLLARLLNADGNKSIFMWIGSILIGITIVSSLIWHSPVATSIIHNIPLGGIGLVLVGISAKVDRLPDWILKLLATSFGIYLCHVLFLEGTEFVLAKIMKAAVYYSFPVKILVSSGIFILSAICTLVIKRFDTPGKIFLGERRS